jgi:hypothetical protein
MISKTRRRRRRNRRQNDSIGKFADDAWALSKRAIRGLNEVRKLLNVEYKYNDEKGNGVALTQAGNIGALTEIDQGDGNTTRDGNSIKTVDLQFAANIFIDSAATRSTARVIIFRDHENQGSHPAGSDLIQTASNAVATVSPYNTLNTAMGPESSGRFTILYDETVCLSITGEQVANLEARMTLGQHVRWSTATGTDTREGALFIAFFSNEATNTPTTDWFVRVRFIDN